MNQLTTTNMKGNVTAIIPQSIDDVFRVAKGVVMSGLAPDAMTKGKGPDEAVAAIAIAIMSGAELGLKPMVALRSFTVINGRPALYGDGLINVVRQSGKAAYLRTGCDNVDGKMVGWCEAKRSDTGEDKRVEFSQEDAARAGLWQPNATVRKQVWENGSKVWKDDAPNDSPWYRYPQRMLAWRAAGWCLRELFGDVLGGIRDEFEAQEVQDEPQQIMAPPPPAVDEPPEEFVEAQVFDLEAFLAKIEEELTVGTDEDTVIEIWDALDIEATLTDDEPALQRAFDIRAARLEAVKAHEVTP